MNSTRQLKPEIRDLIAQLASAALDDFETELANDNRAQVADTSEGRTNRIPDSNQSEAKHESVPN